MAGSESEPLLYKWDSIYCEAEGGLFLGILFSCFSSKNSAIKT